MEVYHELYCIKNKLTYHPSVNDDSTFVALIAVGAFIRVPLPELSVYIANLIYYISGHGLGSRLGAASVGIYIILGLVGVPILASGGGPSYILQPTFGLFNWLYGWCVCSRTHCKDNGYIISF